MNIEARHSFVAEPSSETRGSGGRASPPWRAAATLSQFAPLLAILSLLVLLGLLLWFLERNEREAQHADLIRDTLWVEQTLQFHLGGDEELLDRLALDIGNETVDRTAFLARARQLLANNPEMIRVAWHSAAGRLVAALPGPDASREPGAAQDVSGPAGAPIVRGRSYTAPSKRADGATAYDVVVPISRGSESAGSISATISLEALLVHQVPWWITEKRAVQIRDSSGTLLASRSRVEPEENAPSHSILFGPATRAMLLTVSSYQDRTSLFQNGIAGAMLVLGLVAVGGLLARERHMRRRQAAEAALQEEYGFRKAMEDSLTVGMRARDLDGRVTYVNQAFCRMIGWSAEELIGQGPPMPYWIKDDMERTQAFHDAVLAGRSIGEGTELTFRRRDGTPFEALVYEAPLIDAQGRQRGWMGSFVDITDRRRAEETARAQAEQLQQTARLVAIGETASLLAHDLNQPLAAITSYNTGIRNRVAAGDIETRELDAALGKIGDAAHRAGQIIRRVQDFVRQHEPRFEPVDLGLLVRETVAILLREPRSGGARIVVDSEPQPLVAIGDRVLIEQVLVNLIGNAEEAMARADVPARRRRIDIIARRTQGESGTGEIEVAVADRGPGIAGEMSERVFKPFVSTKPGGMGLGLAICRSIMEAHRGRLACSARKGGGALFTVRLPAAP